MKTVFGEWLRKMRLGRRETQGAAARAIGVSRQAWNAWENGQWVPAGRGAGGRFHYDPDALAGKLGRWCGTDPVEVRSLLRAAKAQMAEAAP